MTENETLTGLEIAVIGMSGRFPGAGNVDEFWQNIKNGVESIPFLSEEELEKAGVAPEVYNHPDYVKSGGGFVEGMEYFDADFFGYTPTEADLLDPQVRLFHESCWAALEDAGYDPGSYEGLIGLFGGAEDNTDWKKKVLFSATEADVEHTRLLLSCKDFVSARVSYKLNLNGPVYAIVTGCSTAMTSIHLACRSLLGGECDMALAGGVYINPLSLKGYIYQEGTLFSRDGHLRAFDARSGGSVFSSGIGVVLLKTLEEASVDGDHVYAVIKGSAVNSDGNRKVNFTAPSIKGQAEVIKQAYRAADVDPETIGYLETHGTGTPLGDPIEINALKQAFNTDSGWTCPIGSVKSNIGHLDTAAGVTGFIKTVLVLKHKLIPPTLHYETPNPKLELEKSPFYVNTQLKEWESDGSPRRAAVSSFGFGGTNAHVVMEEWRMEHDAECRGEPLCSLRDGSEYQLILLSAKTGSALEQMTRNLGEYFKENPEVNLADAAYTLQVGRQPFRYRRMCVGSTADEITHALAAPEQGESREDPPVIFMFSGQGSQYVNMGLEIYRSEPVFREQMDRGFEILKSLAGRDFKDILYPSRDIGDAQERMNDILNSGPIKFIFEYSLAKLLMHWGIHPHAVMGHSFGEYAAACLAGVFSVEDALKLALLRGKLLLRTPPGGTISIPLPEDRVNLYLQSHPDISLAAVNSSSLCFVSGPHEALDRLEAELKEKGVECMRINVPCAAHSHMMKKVTGEFENQVRKVKLQDPSIPFISGLTGDWISTGEITDPVYWANHLEKPVRFCQGAEKLLNEPHCIFVQVGPDKGLPLFINQHENVKPENLVINLVRHKKDNIPDMNYLLNQLGRLWLRGVKIEWGNFHARQQRRRMPLPTYPFEGQRYWLDIDPYAVIAGMFSRSRLVKRKDVSDWLYTASWKRCPLPGKSKFMEGTKENTPVLIFSDACEGELGVRLARKLEEKGREVMMVKSGEGFEQENSRVYRVDPAKGSDYDQLFNALKAQKKVPGFILHLWNVTGKKAPGLTADSLESTLDLGLYSMIHIVQSLGRLGVYEDMHFQVVTDNMLQVVGEEVLYPDKAAILGAVQVIPREYPNISCHCLDIILPEPGSPGEEQLDRHLLNAFTHGFSGNGNPLLALRGSHYWTQAFESIPVEKPQPVSSRLKEKGVYLVTGGLGGIGFVLSEYLVKAVKARLILTGRSRLPAKDQWQQWLDNHKEDDPVSQKIKKVMDLEEWGGEVLVFSADSADRQGMQEVLNRTVQHFGRLNGIIHTAGLVDEYGVIQGRTREMTENILAPKVKGTLVLHELTRDMPLDFFVICSSLASLFPAFGEVGYAAANIFIDAFAHYKTLTDNTFTVSINWDTWQEVGAAVDIVKRKTEEGKAAYVRLKDAILPAEGVEAFTLILENPNPQVVVSTKDLGGVFRQRYGSGDEKKATGEEKEKSKETTFKKVLRPRPELSTTYAAPRSECEQTLGQIWQEYFGIEKVGIHDDFFELGGDSLMATIMSARIHKRMDIKIPLTEIFQGPTIELLSRYIGSLEKEEFESIPLVEKKEYYPLSPAQKRLFILQQLEPGLISYNSPAFFILEGELDKELLEQSLERMIRRHESLRTSFEMIEKLAVQRVKDHKDVEFEVEYYTGSDEEAGTIVNAFMRPFDLRSAPLLRVGLIRIGETRHIFMFDMHHIVTDGTSLSIFSNEFLTQYEGRQLPHLILQYKDFSEWQNHLLKSGEIKKQEEYWLKEFSGEIPILDLPADYPRPEVQSFEGRKYRMQLSAEDSRGLNRLSKEQDATLYMTTLAAFKILLSRLSGRETVIVGTSTAGRQHEDLQPIIGMFVNTLALKTGPAGDKTFNQFLRELKQKSLAAFENQDYPFEDLVEKLTLNRDMSRNPLFDVMYSFQNFEASPVDTRQSQTQSPPASGPANRLQNDTYIPEDLTSRFDLTLFVAETADSLLFTFEYCTKLFKPGTIEEFGNYLKKVVSTILGQPGIELGKIEIISEEEKKRVLYDFNHTDAEFPGERTLHELFTDRARRSPDLTALVGRKANNEEPVSITYGELNRKSDRLAHLLTGKGIRSDALVGIMMERSVDMIIGILGILKAGAAYMPIAPDYPEERKKYMLDDSGARGVVSIDNCQWTIDMCQRESGRDSYPSGSSRLAYVIYTSGSTGKPKGVLVEHRSAVNILSALQREYPLGERDAYLFKTSYLFDVSVAELFGWFFEGGRLAVLEKDGEKDPHKILTAVERFCVTHINFVPSMFNLFVEGLNTGDMNKLSGLKYIFLAGEALLPQTVRKFRKLDAKILLANIYGPTEGTVYSCNYSLSHWGGKGSIPIGKPMQNVKLYILDNHNHLQPGGIPGELYISGAGLARGYLNQPELTAERFCFRRPGILRYVSYRTGDLAKWLPDGNIEFLGRIDHQVKIRGFRIELGEIESQLLLHSEIKEAVVTVDGEGTGANGRWLCAYIVPGKDRTFSTSELREFLSRKLPGYMIPSYFIELNHIPLTAGGKIDRKSLPKPEAHQRRLKEDYVAPGTDMENVLARIWREVLQLEEVGIDDNFFDIGGNSYNIIQVSNILSQTFGKSFPVMAIFRYPTIRAFAQILDREGMEEQIDIRKRSEALKRAKGERIDRYRKRKKQRIFQPE